MKELAPGVWSVSAFPIPWAINVYLIEDVVIDASRRQDARRILKQLRGRAIGAHALTHVHPDHNGASKAICEHFGVPYWVGEGDEDAAVNPQLVRERQPNHPITQYFARNWTGPGHPVDRVLREGDEVAGFRVIATPGHSRGHVVFFRESDRVLIVGDVLCNQDSLTGIPGLQFPKNFFTPDPEQNRQSAKKLVDLEPNLVLFGHGRPLRNPRKFTQFLRKL
jgi:hydroxyacylglutathione hydrolase